MGIEGSCFTNLDDYQAERWPEEFVAVPRKGEGVEAGSGKVLYVCAVTHRICGPSPGRCGTAPEIRVELTRRDWFKPSQ